VGVAAECEGAGLSQSKPADQKKKRKKEKKQKKKTDG